MLGRKPNGISRRRNVVQFLLVRHRNGVPRLFQWPSRNERKARDGRRRVDRNESKAMMGKESGTLHEQLRFAVWNSQGVEVVQELLNRSTPLPNLQDFQQRPVESSRASPPHTGRERMGFTTLQKLQDPILLLPWVCSRVAAFQTP